MSSTPCSCGGSRERWTARVCCASRTTTGSAAGRGTKRRCSRRSIGSAGGGHLSDNRVSARACEGRQSERDAAYRQALEPLIAAVWSTAATARAGKSTRRCIPDDAAIAALPLTDGVGWRVRMDAPGRELRRPAAGAAAADAGGAVWRSADSRSARQLDVSVGRHHRRSAAGRHPRDPR